MFYYILQVMRQGHDAPIIFTTAIMLPEAFSRNSQGHEADMLSTSTPSAYVHQLIPVTALKHHSEDAVAHGWPRMARKSNED